MLQVYAYWFFELDRAFAKANEKLSRHKGDKSLLTKQDFEWFSTEVFESFTNVAFQQLGGLTTTGNIYETLFDPLDLNRWDWGMTWEDLTTKISCLQMCCEAELGSYVFFGFIDRAKLYRDPFHQWGFHSGKIWVWG